MAKALPACNLYTVLSVCSAAVCDRANEFLQKSKGDMRHKKTVTGWLRLQNCKKLAMNSELRDIRDVEKKNLFRFRAIYLMPYENQST